MFVKKKTETFSQECFNEQQLENLFFNQLVNDDQEQKVTKLLFNQNILLKRLFDEINQKCPNDKENSQFDNLKKKLFAIEKNWIACEESRKKYRRNSTQLEIDQSIILSGSDSLQDELKQAQKSVQKQQDKYQEFAEKFNTAILDQQFDQLQKEKQLLKEQQNWLKQEERKVQVQQSELDQKEIALNKAQLDLLANDKKLSEQRRQQCIDENTQQQRKKNLEGIQKKIIETTNQLLLLNKQRLICNYVKSVELKKKVKAELGLPLEAIEELVVSTFKERSLIQEQKVYYLQLRETLKDEQNKLYG